MRQAASAPSRKRRGRRLRRRDEKIEEVARHLGYGKSRLYSLFTHEVGMAPNDYRQRIRIKRCCETPDPHLRTRSLPIGIDSGFHCRNIFPACSRSTSA